MIDFLHNELSIGDHVVYSYENSTSLYSGHIIGFAERVVRVEDERGTFLKNPRNVVKIRNIIQEDWF